MKNVFIKKTIAAALTSVALLGVLPMVANAEWKEQNGNKYYTTKDGSTVIGWLYDNEKWYYFNKDGVMQKNTTIKEDDKEYKLDETGAVNQCGALSTKVGENLDIEDATANVAATNGEWVYDEATEKSYFKYDAGKKVTGWIAYNHKWYHLDKNGYEEKNTTVDGHKINEYGELADKNIDLTTTENAHKNTDAYKATSALWKKDGQNWYLFSHMNEKSTGWQKDRGDWYYFDKNGVMQKNTTIKVGDKECKLGQDGAWCN